MDAKVKSSNKLKVVEINKSIIQPGEVAATLELIVKDSQGKVTEHRPPVKSESFLEQFIRMLFCGAQDTPILLGHPVIDSAGNSRLIGPTSYHFAVNAGAGASTYGIQVGSGSTAATITDRSLETQIAHGTGAGQLQYGAITFGAPAQDGSISQFTVTRDFANGSGGAVTVNEVGIAMRAFRWGDGYVLTTIRDVIGGGISVPNGQTLTVNYRPQAAV